MMPTPVLTDDRPGLLGAITGRAEAQVLRLSCLYALMDQSAVVTRQHLTAAIALWDYAAQSAQYLFGDSLGDPLADDLSCACCGSRMAVTDGDVQRLWPESEVWRDWRSARALLARHLVRMEKQVAPDAKRPTEIW